MARVVVVGAGMGGLAVAARLAAGGHAVTLVEQADRTGGKLATYRRDGFAFDTGPSLFTLPAVYRDLFLKTVPRGSRRSGGALEDAVDLQPVEPGFAYRFADGTRVELPGVGVPRVAAALEEALGGGAGAQWSAFLGRADAIWRATRGPFLESALDGPLDLVRQSARLGDLRTIAPFTSLRSLGARYLHDPRLRTLLDRYATYTGSDPRRAPAALAVVPYVEQTFGAWHIGGGLGRLGDAVLERCLALGVDVRLGADVVQVLLDAGRASGVRLADGSALPADVVVTDSDATHLYADLLPADLAAPARRRLAKAVPSLSGFVLLLAVRGRTAGLRHHTVAFPDDYDAEFDAIFGRAPRPVADPTVYVCAPDDPLMRPDDDHEAWFVLVNAPRHSPGSGVDWDEPGLADRYAGQVLEVMARRGLDVRDRLLWHEVRTPADLERATRAPGGSIYGTSSNGPRAAFLRPANRSQVPGLFLVGGSAHPGGGLPLVGMSAAIVAGLVGPA